MEERSEEISEVKPETPKRGKLMLHTRLCKFCGKTMTTTSRVQVVHDECRIEYYKTYRSKRYKKKINEVKRTTSGGSTQDRARKRCFINEYPCEACGYLLITKIKKFYHADTDKVAEHHLCPKCLAEFRLGFLEALTWKPLDEETRTRKA